MKKSVWGLIVAAALGLGLTGINAVSASSINTQAAKYPVAKITTKKSNFTYKKAFRQGVGRPEGIVIHETAEPTWTAASGAQHFMNEWKTKQTYVQSLVDSGAIINIGSNDYQTWGTGAVANKRFISIELCETTNQTNFIKSVNNLAYYTATLLRQYNLKPDLATNDGFGTVWSHYDVTHYLGGTDHSDPVGYFAAHGYDMNQFYALVQSWYGKLGKVKAKASAKNANVIKLGATSSVYAGPSTNYKKVRTLKKGSAWKYASVHVTRGQFWFQIATKQWVRVGGLSQPSMKIVGTSAVRKGPGVKYAIVKTVKKGATYKYSNIKFADGTLWFQIATNQWLVNGLNGKTTIKTTSKNHGVISLGTSTILRAGASDKAKAIRTLPAGGNWKFDLVQKVGNQTWYRLGGNQWVKA
jgi:N-acetylmuramoyl-L-alanine amidase CwlA